MRRIPALLFALVAALAACHDTTTGPRPAEVPLSPTRALGLVEVRLSGLGTSTVTATVPSNDAAATGLSLSASPTPIGSGTASGVQLRALSTGSFTSGSRGAGGWRYLWATFAVRNAGTNGVAYATPRQNVTLLAVGTAGAIAGTPVSSLQRFDGSAADPAIAAAMLPTGKPYLTPTGSVSSRDGDVLQVYTEPEIAAIDLSATTVTNPFPYAFTVRNATNTSTRALAANPAVGQYDGVVTLAYRVPLQATPQQDPFSLTLIFLAVDDPLVQVTESLEEQGAGTLQAQADALNASITLLGNSASSVAGHGIRRICRVRTAGADPSNPTATLVNAGGCSTGAVSVPSTVRVVDAAAAPGGNGTSWATAYASLQDALACARAGAAGACIGVTELWVKQGAYYPDLGVGITPDDRAVSFALVPGVSVYGGFAGGEYRRDQRDWLAHRTLLSGDVGQNDPDANGDLIPDVPGGDGNNTQRIISASATVAASFTRGTVVDGFTIAAASGTSDGGGFRCEAVGASQCSPTLSHLAFVANRSSAGGAMSLLASGSGADVSPLIRDLTFTNNRVVTGTGGAVAISGVSGGLVRPMFVHTTFSGNVAGGAGGGAIIASSATGGTCAPQYIATQFETNRAPAGRGGAVLEIVCPSTYVNVTFWKNSASESGGGIHGANGSAFTNVTFASNSVSGASGDGGALTWVSTTAPSFANVIVWANTATTSAGLQLTGTGTAAMRQSIHQGGCPAGATCTGVTAGDPLLVDIVGGDLRIQLNSPALDDGDNTALPDDLFDLDGDGVTSELLSLDVALRQRIVNATGTPTAQVDIGAHEHP